MQFVACLVFRQQLRAVSTKSAGTSFHQTGWLTSATARRHRIDAANSDHLLGPRGSSSAVVARSEFSRTARPAKSPLHSSPLPSLPQGRLSHEPGHRPFAIIAAHMITCRWFDPWRPTSTPGRYGSRSRLRWRPWCCSRRETSRAGPGSPSEYQSCEHGRKRVRASCGHGEKKLGRLETQHHSRSSHVSPLPLEYTPARVVGETRARNITCIPMEKARRDLNASAAVFLPLERVRSVCTFPRRPYHRAAAAAAVCRHRGRQPMDRFHEGAPPGWQHDGALSRVE